MNMYMQNYSSDKKNQPKYTICPENNRNDFKYWLYDVPFS